MKRKHNRAGFKALIAAGVIFLATAAQAYYFPVQVNIVGYLGIPPAATSTSVRANIIYGGCENVYGVDIGLVNRVREDMVGLECGLVNVSGFVSGVQVGLVNVARELYGVQVGIVNVNRNGPLCFFPIVNFWF